MSRNTNDREIKKLQVFAHEWNGKKYLLIEGWTHPQQFYDAFRQSEAQKREEVVREERARLRKRLLPQSWDENTPCNKMLSEIDNALTNPTNREANQPELDQPNK